MTSREFLIVRTPTFLSWLILLFVFCPIWFLESSYDEHFKAYFTIIPWARVGYELAITISYPTSANGIIVLLNWILVNFILNITKRPDTNVTSGKPSENHMICAPFANLVEWKIWKGRTLCLNYSRQVLLSLSLAVTGEFDAGWLDLIALRFRFLPPLNRNCTKTQLH